MNGFRRITYPRILSSDFFCIRKINLQKTKMSISETLNLELSNAFMGKLKSAKQCFWIILLLLFCCNLILTSYHTFLFFDYYIYLHFIHIFIYNCRSTKGIRNCRIESFEGISLITKTLPEKNCFQLTKKSTSRTFRIFFFQNTN